ncbi:D-alanine--D-alanine ligase B [bacterium BMS3Bbin14]|nr:D-alanine--D-alanine ligase B [bacterium BMS3Abin13]GBE53299.1 D-alanine--D-alanine ligase B [bacterium BMS3Bbin14]HDO29541.1 D-alanine--D-alanine ligase [Desulfobacteraceae bacterium]
MSRLRLALIAGGTSGEREVSLQGAAGVARALDPQKYKVSRYDPATDLPRLAADAAQLDVAFILLHGIHGEDGTMQGFLELLGIPYQGAGVLGSALAMDKNLAKTLYRLHGLPVASWEMASPGDVRDPGPLLERLRPPLVVKPVRQGSSIGMSIVREAGELSGALRQAFAHDRQVMVEEFIRGREITVGVLGNDELTALPLVEVIPGEQYDFFDYEAKYKPGASREVCPAEVGDGIRSKAQEYGLIAHRVLQLRGYSRTDMIVRDGDIFILETNTIPGMTPTSLLPQAAAQAGLSFSALLDRLIELARER